VRLLDLFCGAGGAAMGYHRAGFTEIVGVDIAPQPNYPFEFIQADALEPPVDLAGFDLIHASPPCQAFTVARTIQGREHPNLIPETRAMLDEVGVPYIIENVPGAPIRTDVLLCGSMFGLQSRHGRLRRHRLFELSYPGPILVPPHQHWGKTISVFGHGGHVYHGVDNWREVMGIDWMTRDELSEAIPPAYTEYLGRQFIDQQVRA
jgi:DNA (cytosine-5)-methyltransferase 1